MGQAAGDLGALRQRYRDDKLALFTRLGEQGASTRGVRRALHQLSRLTDDTLRELWSRAGFGEGFSLVAVGGFGRGELFPNSDVDVLLLLPEGMVADSDESLMTRLGTFIGACWDVGLEIGSSVRTASECVAEATRDVTVQTSLLESRLIVRRQAHCIRRPARPVFTPRSTRMAFFVAKTLEMRQRHTKFENTPLLARTQLQGVARRSCATCRRFCGWPRPRAYGKSWDDLARKGLATAFEVAADQAQRGAAQPDPRAAAPDRQAPARRPPGL